MESQDLKPDLAELPTASDFLEAAWQSSAKNAVARGYMAGVLDALRFAKAISVDEYSAGYDRYVYGPN
ncbi:hypothetical protein LH460_06290 [Laribacter hongkongensis]|uniref:hypothetical protein n=1 Tax=Laribacter hongkongensis TaxID=168471 RepID=UPI001EFEBC2D|nr:hypothetical protein [Laribacter hongkongensis]MCG9124280.1 hypothetical protein [Laribacter hongkongensis]